MNQLKAFLTALFVLTYFGIYGVISFMAYFDSAINGDENE